MTPGLRGLVVVLLTLACGVGGAAQSEQYNDLYEPDWTDLDQRPNPAWYDDAKFGLLVSWGVYSVPAFAPLQGDSRIPGLLDAAWYGYHLASGDRGTAAFSAFHERAYPRPLAYTELARRFRAELFDAGAWADVFRRSGARYLMLTAKHHDGYALWPTAESWNWNSADVGPRRDLVAEVKALSEAAGLRFGVSFALDEWFNPIAAADFARYVETHVEPQLRELVQRYQPELVWAEGGETRPSTVWGSEAFLAWLYNHSPVRHSVVVNDRWGSETPFLHGGVFSGDYLASGGDSLNYRLRRHKWEDRRSMAASFGYNRTESLESYASSEALVHQLIDVVSRGGNLLLGVGPTADGRIPVIQQERLADIGAWLEVNGEAIYGTRPWRAEGEGDNVFYTRKGAAVYAILLRWPGRRLVLEEPNLSVWSTAHLVGTDLEIPWERDDDRILFTLPDLAPDELPSPYATVIRLTVVN